jgi:hypothetical protein
MFVHFRCLVQVLADLILAITARNAGGWVE